MSDKKSNEGSEDLDFVTNTSFQISLKKAKRKQTLKFIMIGSISTFIILFALYYGASYNLQKKLANDQEEVLFSYINGANVNLGSTRYVYGFLSAVSHTTIEKTMGDRNITWNKTEEEIPAFGGKNAIDNGRFIETSGFSERFNRIVHYNSFNGEREVAFYYPQLEYEFLPDELQIATELDNNTLAEVAISFNKAYSIKELEDIMGEDNVTWLWVNTTSQNGLEKNSNPDQVMDGPSADGFAYWGGDYTLSAETFLANLKELSEEGKYQSAAQKMARGISEDSFPEVSDITITGAVVTGTPEELKRFENLDMVRASTIGATIDLY